MNGKLGAWGDCYVLLSAFILKADAVVLQPPRPEYSSHLSQRGPVVDASPFMERDRLSFWIALRSIELQPVA